MADNFQLIPDQRQIEDLQRTLGAYPRKYQKVVSRAINKIAVSARQQISVRVRQELAVKATELKQRNIKLRKASYTKLAAFILISGSRIPLSRFGAKQTQAGTSYKISPSDGRKTAKGAFLATMPSGHRGVFKRKGTKRLPLSQELRGPSVPQVVLDLPVFAKNVYEAALAAKLKTELDNQLDLLISGVTR